MATIISDNIIATILSDTIVACDTTVAFLFPCCPDDVIARDVDIFGISVYSKEYTFPPILFTVRGC
jgi:hypothetical protein